MIQNNSQDSRGSVAPGDEEAHATLASDGSHAERPGADNHARAAGKSESILGVGYTHYNLEADGDLYVTEFGRPFTECLFPENHWSDREWFKQHSRRQSGTSSIYRVTTKPANGRQKEIVVKWNRMGQEIPGDEFADADFNSPFEEFSLVMELRRARSEGLEGVYTQKPLAIFVPAKRLELWRTGRKQHKMRSKIDKHVEIELDMRRLYAVIYEWIKGVDAVQACERAYMDEDEMVSLTRSAHDRIQNLGYDVLDRKANHVIVRPLADGDVLRDWEGDAVFALIDYELLRRTTKHELMVRQEKRSGYLRKQRDRFNIRTPKVLPSHLHYTNIFGIGYIHGHTQSTNGELWVVGKDPDLYDYFLPERWEQTLRRRLSAYHQIFHTVTKDNINLVWKVSRVGIVPEVDPFRSDEHEIIDFGYNSPFEEVALAQKLTLAGIPTTYPRAVYLTGVRSELSEFLFDNRRYQTHKHLLTPEGEPILRPGREYISIWGYWSGPDDRPSGQDRENFEGIDALRAWREGIISEEEYVGLMEHVRERLLAENVEDLNLRGRHILLSRRRNTRELIRKRDGTPEARICTFDLLRMSGDWGD